MAKKSWRDKLVHRAKATLRSMKKKYKEHSQDFIELAAEPKLVSLYLWNLSGGKVSKKEKKKRKKAKVKIKVSRKGRTRSPPVSGYALYYVVKIDDEVTLLHPNSLDICKISRRQFDKSVIDIWWPNEMAISNPDAKNKFNNFCNRFKVAETMLAKMSELAKREKMFKQKIVREAIADLKEINLKEVPEYELTQYDPSAGLKAWRENQPTYKKRAAILIQKLKEKEMAKNDSNSGEVSSSATPSSSASASGSSSAASSSSAEKEKKMKKSEKTGKSSKKENKKEKKSSKKSSKKEKKSSKPKELVIPKANTSRSVIIRTLMHKKGKTVSNKDLGKAINKAKGTEKEVSDKKLHAKAKQVKVWAEKQGLKFKESSKGMSIS